MKKHLITLSFLFVVQYAFCQKEKIDSLINVAKNYKSEDTVRVNILTDIVKESIFSDSYNVLDYAKEAIILSRKVNFLKGEAISLNCLGLIYLQTGNQMLALKNFIEAEEKFKQLGKNRGLLLCYNNIGIIYKDLDSLQKAKIYFNKFIENFSDFFDVKNPSEKVNLAACYANLAEVFTKENNLDSAILVSKSAYDICKSADFEPGIAHTALALSSVYTTKKSYQKATEYNTICIEISQKIGSSRTLCNAYLLEGNIYKAYSDFSNAIVSYKKSIELANKNHFLDLKPGSLSGLHECYKALGDTKNALYFLEQKQIYQDTIQNESKTKAIAELQTKYETEKKEQQIKELEQAKVLEELKSDRKTYLIIAIIIVFLLIAITAFFIFYRYRAIQQTRLIASERDKAAFELKAIKAQMNPHFLFNALVSIRELIMTDNKLLASEHLTRFADLSRKVLTSSTQANIDLEDEIDLLTDYIELEKLRFNDGFHYKIEVADNVDIYTCSVPPMLLQPYVENSIKHGLLHKQGDKILEVAFRLNEDESCLIATITDNGIGMAASLEINKKRMNHQSFATSANLKRIDLLNQGRDSYISVKTEDVTDANGNVQGCRISLQIPLN